TEKPHERVMEIGPGMHDRTDLLRSEQARHEAPRQEDQGRRVEDERVDGGADGRHQTSNQTAARRSRYLLYSENRVVKPGSVRTASRTMSYLPHRDRSHS